MYTRSCIFSIVALLILLLVPGAGAQSPSDALPISYGERVTGSTSDITTFTFYQFTGNAGDTLSIMASSSDGADPYLRLYNANGSLLLEQDDISTTDLSARIETTLADSGVYFIGVAGYHPGTFTLSLDAGGGMPVTNAASSPNGAAIPISYGQTVNGETAGFTDIVSYSFSGNAGDVVTISASSSIIDVLLQLKDASGQMLATHDDISTTNLNAEISYTLPAAGQYVIGVNGYSGGPFTLSLQADGAGVAPDGGTSESGSIDAAIQPIAYGSATTGSLASTEDVLLYQFQGNAGDTITLDVTGDNMDPYVVLGNANGDSLATHDDISSTNLNATLSYTLPATGNYLIAVGGYSTGSFTLNLALASADAPAPDPVTVSDVPVGETITGEITDANWNFEYSLGHVEAGQTIIVDVRATSGNLDPLVGLFYGDNLVVENDDRAANDLNSYIRYPQALAGEYSVVVSRYNLEDGESAGSFELSIDIQAADTSIASTTTTIAYTPDPIASGYPQQTPAPSADWTILAYLGGDNNLEAGLLNDLNEFELAGGSTNSVRVIALMDRSPEYDGSNDDWEGVRIYEVANDVSGDDGGFFTPTIDTVALADLGNIDTSYGNNLTDFLVWGITNYPASHYAVVINDHGGAWEGMVTDDSGSSGILTLPVLSQSFATALEATNTPKFDILINDACLMASIEYYAAIAPYFDYSVASPEITFNPGFDMTLLTKTLNENPQIDGGQLGVLLMDKFMTDMKAAVPEYSHVVGGAVTDLRKFPAVLEALRDFARVVTDSDLNFMNLLGQARANAYAYSAWLPEEEFVTPTNVDLGDLMKMLMRESSDPALHAGAQRVLDSINDSIVYAVAGTDLSRSSSFYNIYFPVSSSDFSAAYFDISPLQSWTQLLRTYYSNVSGGATMRTIVESNDSTPAPSYSPSSMSLTPEVSITNVYPSVTSVATPTIVSMEVTGSNISEGVFTVDRILEDGSRVRLESSRIVSIIVVDGQVETVNAWAAGVDDSNFTWEVTLPVVSDGSNSHNETVNTRDGISSLAGRYRYPGEENWQEVTVLFDDEGVANRVLARTSGAASPSGALAEIRVVPGGEFETYRSLVTEDGRVTLQAGNRYLWGENGIRFDMQPAPSGQYELGFLVTAFGGATGFASTQITVNNESVDPALRGYLDPDWGFNFQYPSDWYDVDYFPDSGYLQTSAVDQAGYIFIYPIYDAGGDLASIGQAALDQYSLSPDAGFTPITVAGQEAVSFSYTYSFNSDPDTRYHATALATYVPSLDLGLVFSADHTDPAASQQLYQTLLDTLSFFDPLSLSEADTGLWERGIVGEQGRYPYPRAWDIYSNDAWTFHTPETPDENGYYATSAAVGQFQGTDAKQLMVELLDANVARFYPDYSVISTEVYYGENATWETSIFRYTSPRGEEVVGRMHVTIIDGVAYAMWFEVPAAEAATIMRDYNIMLDGFRVLE